MKIPPRITFAGKYRRFSEANVTELGIFLVQIVAATVACLVSFAVKRLLFSLVSDICSPTQADQFSKRYRLDLDSHSL